MLSGPSTSFSYKPTKASQKKRKRAYGNPTVVRCLTCGTFLVYIHCVASRRRVLIGLHRLAAAPALIYDFRLHGAPHYHDPADGLLDERAAERTPPE